MGRAIRSVWALGDAEYHVRSHRRDALRPQSAEEALADDVALFPAEGIDGGPVASAENDVPESVRVIEVVPAWGGPHGRLNHTAASEQVREGALGGDLIPRVERFEQR